MNQTKVVETEIEIDWQLFKCRCSSINKMLANSRSNPVLTEKQALELDELEAKELLTEKQQLKLAELLVKKDNASKIILSDTCISYLMEEYAWVTQKMVRISKELEIDQVEKGKIVEPESLNLLCFVDGIAYKPNEYKERVSNEYLSGEVDAYIGDSIIGTPIVPDLKSIWDYPTYLCKLHEKISPDHDWQIKGYMDITGAREGFTSDTLVDTPEHVVLGLKWKLLNKMDVATDENPEFKKRWEVLERSMKFSHISPSLRVNKKYVEPMTDFEQQMVYDRVKVCREWLNTFHENYQKLK